MSRTRRTGSLAVAEGAVALVVLLALLVGIPLLLLRLAEWPLTEVPTWEQIRELPEEAVPDEALFAALTVSLWVAWALFVCSVVVELGARARGRAARVNVGGPLQRLAARLVGSLVLSLGTLGLPARLPAPDPTADLALGAGQDTPVLVVAVQQEPSSTPAPAPTPSAAASVVVEPGDHFWGLAETALTESWGRAPRDHEVVGYWLDVVETNRHLLAPPHDPDLIYPQQVFELPPRPADPLAPAPAPAPTPTPPPEPEPAPTPVPTTAPEEEHSGDESPEVGAEGRPTEDPERPGEPAGQLPGEPRATTTTTDGTTTTTEDEPTTTTLPTTTPPTTVDAEPEPGDTAGGGANHREGARTGSDTAEADAADGGGRTIPVGLVGGGLVLAGALVLLERWRRVQQRYRPPARRIRMPEASLAMAEQTFRQAADVDGARVVDEAVRAAAGRSEGTGLPALRWVEATETAVTLVLGVPVPPPPGFEWEGRDRWVSTASVDEVAALAANIEVPMPALVPVGTTDAGADVLVDLEASGVVEVVGEPEEAAALLRSLALTVATSPWAGESSIRLVGLGGDLTDHDRATAASSLAQALDEADAQRERVTEALRALRCQTTREARAVSANPSRWSPLIVVSAMPPDGADDRRRLERLATRADCGVAVVVPAAGDPVVGAGRIVVRPGGRIGVSGVDPELRPYRLEDDDVATVAALLDVATDRAGVDPEPGPEVDAAPEVPGAADELATVAGGAAARNPSGGLAALMAGVDVVVRVLGDVEAVGRSGRGWDETRRLEIARPKVLEVIAYLAMRDTAVEREDVEISLFPDGTSAAKTVYNLVSAARKILGDELFPLSDGRYRLSDRVVTDYALFYELLAQAGETGDGAVRADLLAESLDLVMGEPFTGAGRGFAWVGPHRGIIVAQVIDAAEELAEIHLGSGDWRAAEWAARKGLRAFPTDERMYRVLMRAAAASGNVPGVQRVFRELCQVVADPDVGVAPDDGVHPETLALLDELTGSQRPAS